MRVEEIMTRKVETARAEDTVRKAAERMKSLRIHHLIVMQGREIAGVVSDRDLRRYLASEGHKETPLLAVMTPHTICASPRDPVKRAANLLRGYWIGCLPVVDGGRLAGIVTITDLLDLIGRGAERPVAKSDRWTLKRRGPRQQRMARLAR